MGTGKKILIIAGLGAVLFAGMDFPYFQKQVSFWLSPPNVPRTTSDEEAAQSLRGAPNQLEIARIEVSAPIIYGIAADENEFQKALEGGVVHYPGTAAVGENGNAYVFGHSSDNLWSRGQYKTVFALLPKLALGDEIRASDSEGKIFRYSVVKTAIVSPTDLSYLTYSDPNKKTLTLQTSYPIGTSLKRYVVVAEAQ